MQKLLQLRHHSRRGIVPVLSPTGLAPGVNVGLTAPQSPLPTNIFPTPSFNNV